MYRWVMSRIRGWLGKRAYPLVEMSFNLKAGGMNYVSHPGYRRRFAHGGIVLDPTWQTRMCRWLLNRVEAIDRWVNAH